MAAQTNSLKGTILTILKLIFAFGLLFWMWQSGRIDFDKIVDIANRPSLLAITLISWLIIQAGGAVRWMILLKGLGYQLSLGKALQLHLTGLFFNTVMPGAVGGDLIKATYVILGNRHLGKSPAMTSILMDRIIGLFGLFTIGTVVILFNFNVVLNSPTLKPIAALVIGLVMTSILFLFMITKNYKGEDPILKNLQRGYPGSKFIARIYQTLRMFQNNPKIILESWLISVLLQGIAMTFFCVIAQTLTDIDMNLSKIAMVFPIGILVTALPVAPGGLGVGHVAFDRLFLAIGYDNGATLFNVYVISYLFLNMLGVFGYISLKKKKLLLNEPTTAGKPLIQN